MNAGLPKEPDVAFSNTALSYRWVLTKRQFNCVKSTYARKFFQDTRAHVRANSSVTSATLMWPTVTLMVGSNASSRLLHERRKNTLRCPTVTLPSLCVYGRWMFSSSSAYLTHAIDGHSASAQIPPFGRSEILCVS